MKKLPSPVSPSLFYVLRYSLFVFTFAFFILHFTFPSSAASFSDVSESDWFYPYIQEATEHQLMVGYPDGRFGPWDPINRAEMAKILYVMREDLKSDWLMDNVVELALVLITLLAWVSIVGTMKSISKRPIVIQHINDHGPSHSQPVQKNSRLIAEEPPQAMENRKPKTNWWL